MSEYKQVPASDEAWESGALGNDPGFAKIAEDDIQSRIDEALAMQPIFDPAAEVSDRDLQAAWGVARPRLSNR